MDINGQKYFLIREKNEFSHRSSRLLWHPQRQALTFAQNQLLRLPGDNIISQALEKWTNSKPLVVDKFDQQGRISESGDRLEYNAGHGFLPLVDDTLTPIISPVGEFTDISIGGDGRLVAGYSNGTDTHGILVFHLSKRWKIITDLIEKPIRVLIDNENMVWAFSEDKIFYLGGEPLPHKYVSKPTSFEPVSVNPNAFSLLSQIPLATGDKPLSFCNDDHYVYLLVYTGLGEQFILTHHIKNNDSKIDDIEEWNRHKFDENIPFAIDILVINQDRLALFIPRDIDDTEFMKRDCAIGQLVWDEDGNKSDDELNVILIRERYPMLSQAQSRFVSSADKKIRYMAEVEPESEQEQAGYEVYPRLLIALKRPRYFSSAMATLLTSFDSGLPDTIWHRLYLEGCIPRGCKIIIYAKSFNSLSERTKTPFIRQPNWIFCRMRSEQPFGKGLVEYKKNESGLFELLFQRNKGPVRRLTGRYIQLRLRLEGEGRTTPSIHALKVYYPRFSYQEEYLPEHFHQELAVDPNLDDQLANGADVRERMLAAFEGVLTPIESQVASAEILLNPLTTPLEHLPWLAEAFGQTISETWPEKRQRRWLEGSGELQRCRGTLAGLNLALDIASDGAVQKGQIILVENFRLRRTMSTILGLNMDDEDHPLTLGTGISGNSIVGDSLILADEDAREFLALFAPELKDISSDNADEIIVEEFFNTYANRVTILLHGTAKKQRSVVEKILTEQMPAHVQWLIVETDYPFVLGLSPLLAVDTFIEERPDNRPVVLDDIYLGSEGLLTNAPAFSPQDINMRSHS